MVYKNLPSQFWDKWYHADELTRSELVQQLTGMENHATAVLTNSYLTDLAEYLEETTIMKEDRARRVLRSFGMTNDEAADFIEGVKRGLEARREGRVIPWSKLRGELGLDEKGGDKMLDKQWAMNCILAGVEVARLMRENKLQGATDYLANLTSELTTVDIEYLIGRAYAIVTKKE